jgi:hypothetical protein
VASDCKGRPVEVGTKVRVLELPQFLKRDLPTEEWNDLVTMVGEVFVVYEIDQYGRAWVEKVWNTGDSESHRHSIALDSHEMEVCD